MFVFIVKCNKKINIFKEFFFPLADDYDLWIHRRPIFKLRFNAILSESDESNDDLFLVHGHKFIIVGELPLGNTKRITKLPSEDNEKRLIDSSVYTEYSQLG